MHTCQHYHLCTKRTVGREGSRASGHKLCKSKMMIFWGSNMNYFDGQGVAYVGHIRYSILIMTFYDNL